MDKPCWCYALFDPRPRPRMGDAPGAAQAAEAVFVAAVDAGAAKPINEAAVAFYGLAPSWARPHEDATSDLARHAAAVDAAFRVAVVLARAAGVAAVGAHPPDRHALVTVAKAEAQRARWLLVELAAVVYPGAG